MASQAQVAEVLKSLQAQAAAQVRDHMAPRYGIATDKAMGVPMAGMQLVAKPLGKDHALARALWDTGW